MSQQQNGDAYDLEEVGRACEEHRTAMFSACRSVLHNPFDAEEAVNDAIVNALRNPPLRTVRSMAAWLRTVARNAAIDLRRKRAQERKLVSKSLSSFRDTPTDETTDVQIRNDTEKLVKRALGFLTETQRDNFWLFRAVATGELTDAELADRQGSTPAAMRSRRARVRSAVVEAVKLACLTHDPGNRCGEPIRLAARTPEPKRLHKALRAHVAGCARCRRRLASDSSLIRAILAVPAVAFVADLVGRATTPQKVVSATTGMALVVAVTVFPSSEKEPPPQEWAVPVRPVPHPLPPASETTSTTTGEVPQPVPPPPEPAPVPVPPVAEADHPASTAKLSPALLEYRTLSTEGEDSCDEPTKTGVAVTATGDFTSVTVESRLRDRTVRQSLQRFGNVWYGEIGPFPAGDADQSATVVVLGVAADGSEVTEPGGELQFVPCEGR